MIRRSAAVALTALAVLSTGTVTAHAAEPEPTRAVVLVAAPKPVPLVSCRLGNRFFVQHGACAKPAKTYVPKRKPLRR